MKRFFGRRWWRLVEGRVIDKRHLRKFLARFSSSIATVSVDEYLVEFSGPDGQPVRLTIKEQSVHLPLSGLNVGQTVPLHVNRRGTKAVFGHFEPVVTRAEQRRRKKEQQARDKARFAEKLNKR
jgi:hypothetical protein